MNPNLSILDIYSLYLIMPLSGAAAIGLFTQWLRLGRLWLTRDTPRSTIPAGIAWVISSHAFLMLMLLGDLIRTGYLRYESQIAAGDVLGGDVVFGCLINDAAFFVVKGAVMVALVQCAIAMWRMCGGIKHARATMAALKTGV